MPPSKYIIIYIHANLNKQAWLEAWLSEQNIWVKNRSKRFIYKTLQNNCTGGNMFFMDPIYFWFKHLQFKYWFGGTSIGYSHWNRSSWIKKTLLSSIVRREHALSNLMNDSQFACKVSSLWYLIKQKEMSRYSRVNTLSRFWGKAVRIRTSAYCW